MLFKKNLVKLLNFIFLNVFFFLFRQRCHALIFHRDVEVKVLV